MLAAALLLPACDGNDADGKKDDAQAKDKGAQAKKNDGAKAKKNDDAKAKPNQAPKKEVEHRILAESGLGIGGKLSAFQILNGEDGEEYCQVCRYGSNPKLMAVGTVDDEAFRKDLKDLDAIVKKYGADKVKAFAVITEFKDGKAITPKDPEAAKAKAKALRAELGIDFPIVVPAPEDGGANETWEDYYNITKSRTVMFSDGRNKVQYSAVEPTDFAELGKAIEAVLGA